MCQNDSPKNEKKNSTSVKSRNHNVLTAKADMLRRIPTHFFVDRERLLHSRLAEKQNYL